MKFGVCGGDRAAVRLCGLLAEDGHQVRALALDRARLPGGVLSVGCPEGCFRGADAVILPMPPVTEDGLLYAPLCGRRYEISDILEKIPPGAVICAGGREALPEEVYIEDYGASPKFAVGAAVAAAEGAIELAMGATERTMAGRTALVVGFEALGQVLSARLRGLGAEVTVCARREGELAMARAFGYGAEPFRELGKAVRCAEIILNTLDEPLNAPNIIEKIPADSVFVELSAPQDDEGGRRVPGAMLPGRAAPLSMAELMREGIYGILQEWEL